jgi:hypothetical protein
MMAAHDDRQPCSDEAPAAQTTAYELSLVVDYEARTIAGDCLLTALNRSQAPIQSIPIVLHPVLTVEAVTDEKGIRLPFVQGVILSKGHAKKTVNYVDIRLPSPVDPGQCLIRQR